MPIGPVNVQIARRVLRTGFWSGVSLGMGAVTVDVVYAMLSAFSFTHVLTHPVVVRVVGVAGVLLLTYLGFQCLRAAFQALKSDPLDGVEMPDPSAGSREGTAPATGPNQTAATARRRDYITGLLMTLLNPMTLMFWFVVLPTTGLATPNGEPGGIAKASTSDLPMIATGVFIGTVSWVMAFSTLLALASRGIEQRHERRRKWLAFADTTGGVMLLGFAVLAGWRVVAG